MTKPLRLVAGIGTLIAAVCASIGAQSRTGSDSKLTFEVSSVKPNKSAELGGSFGNRPGGLLVVRNNTLRNMIRNAYRLQSFQIVGGAAWIDTDKFDVTAKAPMENPSMAEFVDMVQALLADRFKVVVHRETRELPIYAIVLARPDGRLGPRLGHAAADCAAMIEAARGGGPPPADRPDGSPQCGTRTQPGRMLAGGVAMSDLARNLSGFAGRMTVDKTGLTGSFDLDLEYTPDQMPPEGTLPPGVARSPADGPSLFTAVQEQLGLKLDSQRGPVDVLVIDSAQQPQPD